MLVIFFIIFTNTITVYGSIDNKPEIDYLTEFEREEIEKLIEENMRKGQIPGLSVTIVKNNKTVYQRGFGYSDIDEKKPVNSKTLFELASNSKAFTALGILNLEKRGQIRLTDRVTKYIPWLQMNYEGKEMPLTIEQVLHQTSGINPNTIDMIPISNEDDALEKTVRTLIGIELDGIPGENFQYATINYDILGLIIEKVSEDTFENYLQEFILNPLDLNNTYLLRSHKINDRIASGYKIGFLKPRLYEAPIYRGNKPAGYIISSGEDMGKWLMIQMGFIDEIKFDKELIEKSHEASRVLDLMGEEVLYAAGWFIEPGKHISHSGMNPNYSSFVMFNEVAGIAVLGNMSSNYVYNIALGINGVLIKKNFDENIPDPNQLLDKVAVGIILVLVTIISSFLFFIIKLIREVNKKERYFKFNGIKDIFKLITSLLIVLGITYYIYVLPKLLSFGGSWKTAFVWSPISLKVGVYSLYIAIWVISFYFVLASYLKKN